MTRDEFLQKFLIAFVDNIPKDQLKKFRIGGAKKDFLWNLFATKLIPCYEGNEARNEYNKADKIGAEEIHFDNGFLGVDDKNSIMLSSEHMTAEEIDALGLIEFYVIGKDFSWCYVVTHELNLCGPYFCYKP
ncbi:MAG: DUF4275 family protein [Clostridia bacterium]|nr:DUF4275 family protein [Clostridia bacterium]